MKIKYVKANPTENKTILVQSVVPRKLQPVVAAAMLEADPDAEQVGFFETPEDFGADGRLQMMGGEFCGNASISAAARISKEQGIKSGERHSILLEVSGVEEKVECIIDYDGNVFTGTVEMPLPKHIDKVSLNYKEKTYELWVVFLPGIIHIIFEKEMCGEDYEYFAEAAIKEWGKSFSEEAVGLIFFDEDLCLIKPLVYVKNTDSLYWERGCGTGTAAVGAYVSQKNRKSVNISVKQPGGTIIAKTLFEDKGIKELKITGKVLFESEGIFNYE